MKHLTKFIKIIHNPEAKFSLIQMFVMGSLMIVIAFLVDPLLVYPVIQLLLTMLILPAILGLLLLLRYKMSGLFNLIILIIDSYLVLAVFNNAYMWFLNPDDSVYEPRTFLFTLILGFVEYFRRETNIENPRWPIIEAFVEKPVTYSDNRIIDPKLDL